MSEDQQLHLAIASDHAGFALKQRLMAHLQARGVQVDDLGTNGLESMDYPDTAHPLAQRVGEGLVQFGVLICGSGNGVNMVANRHPGVRSALAWNEEVAALAREHNNANVLALPARFLKEGEAERIIDRFLATGFEGGRHQRRVEKIELQGS